MYRRLIEDRAYARLAEGKKAEARDDFYAVARKVGSFEAWAGYIDRRLQDGADVVTLEKEYAAQGGDQEGPVGRFVRAYLIARKLPKLDGAVAERESERAITVLRGAWSQLKDKPEALAVMGAVLHERFLHTQDRAAAQRASALYLIALDLARNNPRYRAMLLEESALLQAQVGNWHIALDSFEQREKLPFVDNVVGLAHRLVKAATLLHLDREGDAAKLADEALAIVEHTPRMARYLPLAVDRAALYNLAADHFDRALALYDRLGPLLANEPGPLGLRNRLVHRFGRAAAALGASRPQLALEALAGIERALEEAGARRALIWPHATAAQVLWTYRTIATGLRAKAYLEEQRFGEATQALTARRDLYRAQVKRSPVDEQVRALALVESQLGEAALARRDGALALGHLKDALLTLDPVVAREGKPFDRDQLAILWLATEVHLTTGAKSKLKLRDRLGRGIDQLAAQANPAQRSLLRWLEIYLGALGKRRAPATAAGAPR
jgi:hypothetical protein